ncbi:hypothetical protein AVEN_249857-1 [Araneus ventricosus]|uniref:Uncharacterized protein n=1 Tax=Araneus ventricosus TaxID=182803 RepID=A0A4Y2LE26_ARAVE|nr:hypothetical protein AVEN_249857-1 [Araneus ventricosus]
MTTPPWQMTVNCDWTSEEIRLAFLRFAETLTSRLKSKKKAHDFDKWFSVQILIKNVAKVDSEVDCLNDCVPALKRVFSALKGVDLKIQWKLGRNKQSVHLVPESFYNFWFSRFAVSSEPTKFFKVPGNVRVSFGESSAQESSDYECPTHISNIGSSETVHNYRTTKAYHSDDGLLDDEIVPTVPQNIFRNNPNNKMFGQENVAYFSSKKTSSTAQQDISPHSRDNNDMLGLDNTSPKSNTPICLSPRRTTTSISSTSPRTPPFPSSGTPYLSPQENVLTAQSPEKSFLKSPNRIEMSPSAQRKSPQILSPRSSANSQSGYLSNATSENADQNCSFKINFNDSRFSAQNSPTTEQSPNLNNSQHRTPPGSINTVKPKTVLKSHKKTIPTKTTAEKKRHSASCPKYKKVGSTLLKAESKISTVPLDLKNIKITLQNDLAQGEAQRIVKPVSGVRPGVKASQVDMMDSEESNFQCNVSEDVFQKIINFLKSKVMVKRKDLTPQQQQKKALSLAQAFIQTNVVVTLDKRIMKLLSDFSDQCI